MPDDTSWPDAKKWAASDRPFIPISSPSEIEYYLQQRNRRHFGQAQGTPFTIPPLSSHINWNADTDTAAEICGVRG